MGKRQSSDDEGVDLFPFMSILACLIGILTLMISVMSQVKEMEDRNKLTPEEYDLAVVYRDLKIEIEKLRKLVAEMDKRIQSEDTTLAELEKLKESRLNLQNKLDELEKDWDPTQTDEDLQKIIELLRGEVKAINNERPVLDKRLAELKNELKNRKEAPKPEQSVLVRPGGIGSRAATNLFFVECNSTGIVMHERDVKPITVPKAAIPSSEEYHKFLTRAKKTRDSMVLFLVRKAGNENYLWAAGVAESEFRLRTGKLPMPNDGKIDLSLFYN
jgi:hypothetical protein